MKKVFIISAVLLGITILFLVVYNFLFRKTENTLQNNQINKQDSEIKKTATQTIEKKQDKIALVSKQAVFGAVADKKTEKILYYSASDGTIWQVDSDGLNEVQITNTKLSDFSGVVWSPDRLKVLTTFNKNGSKIFFVYDNVQKKGIQLKSGLDNAVWDSLGAKIVYKYYDSKNRQRSLNIADSDGKNWSVLVDNIPFKTLSIAAIPSTAFISFWNFPDSAEESSLQAISVTGGEVKSILNGKIGADYLWSPDGSQALVSSLTSKENKTITLGLVNFQGQYRDLGIPTMVSKCIWSVDSKTIYYALPGGIPAGSNMPNDYQNKKFTTQDTFWKINITTGNKERIVELSDINNNYDVSDVFLSPAEDSLFFINRIDGKLYRIAL